MVEVIHERETSNGGNGMGFLLGVVLLIIFGYMLFVFGLPYMRGSNNTQINVPDKVDVNIRQDK